MRSCSSTICSRASGGRLGAERRDADEAAELSEERAQDRELGALGDPEVEPLVQVEELLVQPLPGRAPLLHEVEPEPIEVVDLHHLAGASHRDGLERPAQVLDLAPVFRA